MALRFSSSKRQRRYNTGLASVLMLRRCPAISQGMPGMLEGFHAKTSALLCKNSVRADSMSGDMLALSTKDAR